MELSLSNTLLAGDQRLIDHIVGEVKSQGIFDQFRKECIADVDTKPAYQNLRTRVEGSVNSFLSKQTWKPDLNKNQLRETLRKHIHDAPYLDAGVERIVDQVVNPKVYSVFMPQIEDVVYKFLGIERPKARERNGACGLKDLLPKDLDPVSPESDKNSFKDLSFESVDASDNLNEKEDDKAYSGYKLQDKLLYTDKDNISSENGHISSEEKTFNEACKTLSTASSNMNLNISGKSDDKMDEEEEDSPIFEPIDIMNLNESNISNDSHLSGISELTSHRSKSPDFSNELSRDNFDCSNQDSQLSKVSSDSRLSIVTDFGSSNHGLTPIFDTLKDETMKDKYEGKNTKDNFRTIKEFDLSRNKVIKNNFEFIKCKDIQGSKDLKDIRGTKNISRENSRDATDSGIKDKNEYKSSKEKIKDNESIKFKSTKEKINSKDGKYPKEKSNEKKKMSSHSSVKYDKHSKNKPKEKTDQIRDNFEKAKDSSENLKENASKLKDEKLKETDKKDNINKEAKDLKDLYKEKIRELREKKELTEKEKLNKDKPKETKDRKDSSKDKKSSRKEHKSSSSSSSSKTSFVSYHENKSSSRTSAEKATDGKDKRIDMKDKMRREEKRLSKDSKSKTHLSNKTDLSDKSEKYDLKKISRTEKEDKTVKVDTKKDVKATGEKTNGKKNAKNCFQSKTSDRNDKPDSRKDSKNDSQPKDKKRKEEKKSKMKDDHSSLRKNSNDRRSTDRDGSNGSNSKTSQSNNSSSNSTSQKSGSSSLTKENQVNNSNSETSDNIEEMQMNDMKFSHYSNCKLFHKTSSQSTSDKSHSKIDDNDEAYDTQEEVDSYQTSLPLKKRHLYSDEDDKSTSSDVVIKKPKFAKNIHEAKKLMKIRKQMEKQKKEESSKEDKKAEKKIAQETEQAGQSNTMRHDADNLASMPDDERVQIIEIPDEEYDEPYPEKELSLTLDERSIMMLGAGPKDFLNSHNAKATFSNMELCIKESLSEIVSNISQETAITQPNDLYRPSSTFSPTVSIICTKDTENLLGFKDEHKDDLDVYSNGKTQSTDAIVCAEESSDSLHMRETSALPGQEEATVSKESEFTIENKSAKQLIEGNKEVWNCHRGKVRHDNEEVDINNSKTDIRDNEGTKSREEEQIEICTRSKINAANLQSDCTGTTSFVSEDNEDCRYFKTDNERSEKFSNFLESLELVGNTSLEDIIESLGGKVVSSVSKSMAPRFSKPKRLSSPLLDILVNNSNNNNDGHKQTLSSSANEDLHGVKKRKLFTAKKPRLPSFCNTQGISNGENFVMPLSPDSDVSATSEKTASSNVTKEEKSRNRSSQRYSSDDLYKPRPLFSSSSRRSRRSNQA